MPPLAGRRGQTGRPEDAGPQVTTGQVAAPVQAQQRQQGPGWVDFGRLLSANRPGALRMADNLAAGVRKEGDAVNAGIQSGTDSYQQALGQKTTNFTPGNMTPEQADAAAAGSFQGPKDWTEAGIDVAGLAGKAAAAQDKAKNLTTDYGRAALLRAQVKGPYSAGMSGLDAALAGGAGGAMLNETAKTYGDLSQRLMDARAGASGQYAAATEKDTNARNDYKAYAQALRDKATAEQQAARDDVAEKESTYGPVQDLKEEQRKKAGKPGRYGGRQWTP